MKLQGRGPGLTDGITMNRAKQYLIQYQVAVKRIRVLKEELNDLKAAEQITQSWEGDRVQTTPEPDKIGRLVARISDKEAEIQEAVIEKNGIMLDIYGTINKLQDPDHQLVLQLRYIKCYKWQRVAEEMGYEEPRTPQRKHEKALLEVEKLI